MLTVQVLVLVPYVPKSISTVLSHLCTVVIYSAKVNQILCLSAALGIQYRLHI